MNNNYYNFGTVGPSKFFLYAFFSLYLLRECYQINHIILLCFHLSISVHIRTKMLYCYLVHFAVIRSTLIPIYSTDTYLTAILLTNSVSSKPLNPPNYLCKSINSAVVLLLTPSVNKKVYYCARQCTDIFSIVFPTPKTTFNKHLYGFTYFCKIINSAVVLLPKPSVNNKVYYCALLCTDIFSVVIRTPKTTFNKHLYCYSYIFMCRHGGSVRFRGRGGDATCPKQGHRKED